MVLSVPVYQIYIVWLSTEMLHSQCKGFRYELYCQTIEAQPSAQNSTESIKCSRNSNMVNIVAWNKAIAHGCLKNVFLV